MNIVLKQLKLARRLILNGTFFLLQLSFQRNSQYFYGRYFGTDHPFVLVIKNLLHPIRIIKKLLYGQIVRIPFTLSASNPAEELPELSNEWQKYVEILKRDGIVFIPGFFKKSSKALNENYKLNHQEFPPRDEYYRFYADSNDLDIFNIVVDPMMLTIVAKYYGCQPYYRDQPGINCTHLGTRKQPEEVGFNDFWHYDTVNQMTAHILLNDISESDSCMFYAKGSHRTHREYISKNDYYYSEEYMNDHFEIVPCIGESGTLVIFDPNGLHRVDLKLNTFRSHLHLNFVPGNDFLERSKDMKAVFTPNIKAKIVKLKQYQSSSLSHLIN
jgi:hypothetical protein